MADKKTARKRGGTKSPDINKKLVWKYIKERNSTDPGRLERLAVIDCTRQYTFKQMFTEWERYAAVFSHLGIGAENRSRVGIAGTISAEPLFSFYGLNFDKRIHDTVPALYVVPDQREADPAEAVRRALVNVYLKEKQIERSALPTQFILVNEIPCNANGKLDLFKITRDRLAGEAYNIIPVHKGKKVVYIETEFVETQSSIKGGTLPEGMEGRSALGIYELFNNY